jgi:L-seryl-tRNA(Ser) seleniumtransferase
MNFTPLALDGVVLITPDVFEDQRGFFMESWNQRAFAAAGIDARAVDAEARVGGGGGPEHPLPSAAVSLPPGFAEPLRLGRSPVLGYVEGDRTLLDLRSVPPAADDALARAVLAVAGR